jgi:hypothetical protein
MTIYNSTLNAILLITCFGRMVRFFFFCSDYWDILKEEVEAFLMPQSSSLNSTFFFIGVFVVYMHDTNTPDNQRGQFVPRPARMGSLDLDMVFYKGIGSQLQGASAKVLSLLRELRTATQTPHSNVNQVFWTALQ